MIIKNPTIIIKGKGGETLGGEYNIEQVVDGDNCELVITTAGQPENKLAQVADRSVTELTAEDLTGATRFGAYAFGNCNKLVSIEIPDTVEQIREYVFVSCSSLPSIEIPDNISNIANYAFSNCSSLAKITLGQGLVTCAYKAFDNCSKLKEVHIKNLSKWFNIGFANDTANPCYEGKASLYLNNEAITDLVIPDNITEVKKYAFIGVSSLETVTISNNVTKIGDYAFGYCNNLTSIAVSNSVTSIASAVFYSCSKLTTMTILATTPPTLASTSAISTATTTIYIPAGTLSAYQTATNWSNFADKFVEMEA